MFFTYLFVFIVIVATPFIINEGIWIFSEDETEALMLLIAGVISFVIYRLRDYQVFEYLKEKMKLQRSVAQAQKELSQSYSYIGHANRRTDIIYEIFSDLSHISTKNCNASVRNAMRSLPYADNFCFRFLDVKTKKAHHKISASERFEHLPDLLFCKKTNSHSYRHKDMLFIYSESLECNLRACVALPYSEQAEEDIDFFKALTAYFIMVYAFHSNSCTNEITNV